MVVRSAVSTAQRMATQWDWPSVMPWEWQTVHRWALLMVMQLVPRLVWP